MNRSGLDGLRVADVEAAVDAAGHGAAAVVAEYVAAVGEQGIELAVEFLVPPASVPAFAAAVEEQLAKGNPCYAAARHRNEVGPATVRVVGAGTFHQWRVAWKPDAGGAKPAPRWPTSLERMRSIVRQGLLGHREFASV